MWFSGEQICSYSLNIFLMSKVASKDIFFHKHILSFHFLSHIHTSTCSLLMYCHWGHQWIINTSCLLDMCLWNMDALGSNKVKIWQKSQSYILTQPHPTGHVMSVTCVEPIGELAVQVWLLYHHPNFKYCTLFVSGTELWTDKRTDRRMIRLLDAPGRPFRPGA